MKWLTKIAAEHTANAYLSMLYRLASQNKFIIKMHFVA